MVEAGEIRLVGNSNIPAPVEEFLAEAAMKNEVHKVSIDSHVDRTFAGFNSARRLARCLPPSFIGPGNRLVE